ncbi:MAG: nuclear transport factor 2 family protein [Cyclobacteriaceae bacterium]|nr:nuclear transport factor 2 family protein [Cyclobacteriaceae bacterium]
MNEKDVIEKFYKSFQQKDWQGMQSCYHDDIVFSDPAFPHLRGSQAKAMWHMLTTSAKDLVIAFNNVRVDGHLGSCDWEAWYTFSKTGGKVHNKIHAEFEFKDGKIIKHTDDFSFSRWAGMALGLPGKLLGWTPWLKGKVQATAAASLAKFTASQPAYSGTN